MVLEFESAEAAKKFWESDDYAPVMKMRHESAQSNIVLVEGA